jgi:hypothetical protein
MLDYLAYMESIKWMRESIRNSETEVWRGISARPHASGTPQWRHRLAATLRGAAARLDPMPA